MVGLDFIAGNSKIEIRKSKSENGKSKLETGNSKFETRNSKIESRGLKSDPEKLDAAATQMHGLGLATSSPGPPG
jgi:hypothetical protein